MDKKVIMQRAWEIKREDNSYIFGLCLKMAWAEARADRKQFTGYARVRRVDSISGNEDASFYTFKRWEKGGIARIYVNDYQRRTVGYIDVSHGKDIITDYSKKSGQYMTIKKFVEEYDF